MSFFIWWRLARALERQLRGKPIERYPARKGGRLSIFQAQQIVDYNRGDHVPTRDPRDVP